MILFMLLVLLAGLHMIVQPTIYVGRGPIPAQSATNVRAMGWIFTLLGGAPVAFVLLPTLLSLFVPE